MAQIITIGVAKKEDLDAVFQLEQRLFGDHCYPDFFIRQAYDCWPAGLLVAREQDNVIGYALCAPQFNAMSLKVTEGWILALAVDTSVQGRGVGRKLIQEAMEVLTGCEKLWLTVHPDNYAKKLYQQLGFTDVEQESEYFGVGQPRIKMVYVAK
ncbi:GNAT family N-acetyltransferase [Photobacterium toruni]|uniref:Putative acetyltransferase n=1 Tax=Photobacterium toruni TaxID=1935446 RepID=A0A1T4TPP6_9GAMM|nr:GNAT family N-acetyltransferase [Photobacterium toruni]MEC6814431.1 GNAT family N-acetyltransferase [Photobacterium toruni]SKA42445.1 putative acetyltransferase [Photobacterium toruni]